MNRHQFRVVVGLVCILVACSHAGDETEAKTTSQPGAAIAFCEDFYGVLCQQLWRCGCNQAALEYCEHQVETCSTEGFFVELEEGLSRGWLRYDAQRAADLVARVRDAPMACEDQVVVLGFDSLTGRSFDGAFPGTLPVGAECGEEADDKSRAGVSYCGEGLLCVPARDDVNRCVPIAGAGQPCPILPGNVGSSCFERRPPDPDGTFTSAVMELVCVPDGPGSDTGTCRPEAPEAAACLSHAQCETGFCRFAATGEAVSGTCAPQLANGEECTEPATCESGRCDFTEEPSRCSVRSADGEACLIDEDCLSGGCAYDDSSAEAGTCGIADSDARLPPGSACTPADTCEGGPCVNDVCLQPICADYVLE
jgi:hypothetical protein